ncbi:MAG: FAD:protein FMN transferase [Planctomycetota bacterium]|nr:FAD:protein FMN transferase [Planctomycetota bacterium]
MRSLGLLAALAIAACASSPSRPAEAAPAERSASYHRIRKFGAMGTEVVLEAEGPVPERLERALLAAEVELRRVEDVMTTWRDSPLMRLNASSGRGPVPVSEELARMIQRALDVAELTGGAFDPTYKGAGDLWDFKAEHPRVPSAEELEAALTRVGWARVHVDLPASTVDLPAGMAIGLGGIAKGYGVDRAMDVLREHGVEHGIVNAGGDLKALGQREGRPWRIAIQHPRDREALLAAIPVSNTALVTSGDYERFFELDGVRYHHILDPRTGAPARGCMTATVVAPDAALADALATALCVEGPSGLRWIEALPRLEALVVDMDGKVHVTAGLER